MESTLIGAFLIIVNLVLICETSELISVVTLYRHGARAPIFTYEKDPYKNIASIIWPEGLGHLTNEGKIQQYELGSWFRNRYKGFVPERYHSDFLNVWSSDVDRCLMSASVHLAGFYPPKNQQIWNEYIPWQPIPIHTRPEVEDALLAAKKPCDRYDELYKEIVTSTPYLKYLQNNKDVLDYLAFHTGRNVSAPNDVMIIHDILFIESRYNLILPKWTEVVFPRRTQPFVGLALATPALSMELARLKSGPLIDFILTFLENSTVPEAPKYLMLSGHDTTIANLLSSFKLYDLQWPEYASTVIFELRRRGNEKFVKIFFKNSTALYEMKLNQCQIDCNFEEFTKIIEPLRINSTEWEKACSIKLA